MATSRPKVPARPHRRGSPEAAEKRRAARLFHDVLGRLHRAYGSSPEAYGAFLRKETAKWSKLLRDANIKPSE